MENLTLTGNTLVILIAGGLIVWVVNRRVRRAKREKLESKRELSQNEKDIKTYIAEQKIGRGARWFYWIAGLSALNSYLYYTKTRLTFPAGLMATKFTDVLSRRMGMTTSLLLEAVGVGVFVACGYFASKHKREAFAAGMMLYAADLVMVIYLLAKYKQSAFVIDALFHVLALKGIWVGWVTLKKLG